MTIDTSKFKSSGGKWYTRQLFWEEWINLSNEERVVEEPPFTLWKDKPGKINLGREYVKYRDPSGYKVAVNILGDYQFWTVLMKCTWFKAAKELWDKELDALLTSEAMEKIQELMNEGFPAQSLAAAKYIANSEYRKDRTATKGRPTKAQVQKEASEQAAVERDLAEDFKRITLVK